MDATGQCDLATRAPAEAWPRDLRQQRRIRKGFPCHFSAPIFLSHLMKLGIINSAFHQVGIDTVTGLKHVERIGFDCVDVFTEAVGISRKEVALVARTSEKLNLPVVSLPVVSVGLVDFNEPVREYHLERTKKFIDLAADWSARNILLVLGEYIWQREVIPAAAQWQWGLETCRRLGDYA